METPPHGTLHLSAFSPSLRLTLRAPNDYIKPQIHPLPVSRSVGKQGCAAEKCDFPCASRLFEINNCVSANRALRNKPPICRDERPWAEKVNAAFSIKESP